MTGSENMDGLLRRLRFCGNPLDMAEESRVAALFGPFPPDRVKASPAAWLRLKPLAERQWQTPPVDFPSSPLADYLLLSMEQTRRLADWLGVLAYCPILRVTLKGSILQALRQAMPHCYPDVLRQAKAFQKWQEPLNASVTDKSALTPQQLRRHGYGLLLAMFAAFAPAVLRRWLLQFPPEEIDAVTSVPWTADAQTSFDLLDALHHRGLIGA